MKMTAALVERTLNQFESQAIPDDHPSVPQLNEMFGEHTYFLNGNGLHIVEPSEPGQEDAQTGQVIKIAAWHDAERTSLAPHEPEPTDVVVALGSGNSDAGA